MTMRPHRYNRRQYTLVLCRALVDNLPQKAIAAEFGIGEDKVSHIVRRYQGSFHAKQFGGNWRIKFIDMEFDYGVE